MEAYFQTTSEVAVTALQSENGCESIGMAETLPTGCSGAYIALLSPDIQMQIGIAATGDNCRQLAASLMYMEPDDPELDDSVMTDALGEIVNIIAGALKQKMDDRYSGLTLGLPMMIHGHIQANDRQQLSIQTIKVGDTESHIVLLMDKG